MRKLLLPFFAILFFLAPVHATIDKVGKLDTLNAVSEETRLSGDGYGTVGFQLTGTWSGTVTFEGTVNGTTWVSVYGYNRASGSGALTTTSNGVFVVSSGGLRYVRARMSSYTSGDAFVQGLASIEQSVVDGGASSTGGGGAGDASAANQVTQITALEIIDDIVHTDDAAFTPASGKIVVAGGVFDDVSPDAVNEGDGGAVRMSSNRVQYGQIRDAAGNERGANVSAGNALLVDASATTQPISAASLPLPSGAATAAKQPALGTAGSSSTDVISVQGIASGTALPVSIASVPSHAVTNAGTFVTQVDGAALTSLQLTDNLVLAEDAAHASGDPGLLPLAVRRDANTTLTATDGDYAPLQLDAAGSLKVAITAGAGSGGTSIADDAAFTVASTSVTPVGGTYISAKDAVNDGDAGAFAMTQYRAVHTYLVDANGDAVSVGGGTQYTEDAAETPAASLTLAGSVRRDTPASSAGTTGDNATLNTDANGRLWTSATIDAALPAGTNAIGKLAANSGVDIGDVDVTSSALPTGASTAAKQPALGTAGTASADVITVQGIASMTALKVDGSAVTQPVSGTVTANAGSGTMAVSLASVPSHAVTNAGTFATQATLAAGATTAPKAEDVAAADADVGMPAYAVRKATPANQSGTDGDYEPMQISAGRLWTSSTIDAALPAGTNAIGKLAANSGVDIGDVDVTSVSGTVTVGGVAAHDAAVSGSPVLAGVEARTSNGTAVANGDVTRLQGTIEGKLVTKPHSVYGATWTYAAASGGITNTTAATMKAAAGAGVRVCLTGIQVINGHATVSTEVSVKDGAAGTVIHRGFAQAAGGGYAATFDVPICGTANTLMEVVPVTTGSAIYVNAQGYTSAE